MSSKYTISKYTIRMNPDAYAQIRQQAKTDGVKLASLFLAMIDAYMDKSLPPSVLQRAKDLRAEVIERAYADRVQA